MTIPRESTGAPARGTARGKAGSRGLIRALGLWDSTLLVIGLVIGSAVFLVTGGPGGVAHLLPSPGLLLVGWIAGGILSFAGALVYAELGAALPRAGGQYVFLREAYGDLTGFLYGWTLFAVIHTGTLAALAVGYARYFGIFFPALGTDRVLASLPVFGHALSISAGQLNAVGVIVPLPIVKYLRVKEGTLFQGIITVVKIASFAGFMILGVAIGKGSWSHFVPLFGSVSGGSDVTGGAVPAGGGGFGAGAFILSRGGVLWAA